MPGVPRLGVNQVKKHLEPLVAKGLESVLLFGVTDKLSKVISTSNRSSLKLNFINRTQMAQTLTRQKIR